MIIDAEFNEIEDTGDELDLAEEDSLPWLESDDDHVQAGSVDTAQMVGLIAVLLAIGLIVVGGVYFFSNYNRGPVQVVDGSTIEAPEGPYKERPEEAGGKEFPGTNDVAPGVGQGKSPESQLADGTGAGSGEGNVNVAMPPIEGGGPALGSGSGSNAGSSANTSAAGAGSSATDANTSSAAASPSASEGVGVQLAAYSSRARAEQGWRDLQRQSKALEGLKYRVVEGRIDIGTVYRLQAVAATRSEADALCRTLKGQGLDCQVKP
ncbi:MAG: SPOR domain-containing protein [Pseudomonadota bacterium]